MILLIDLRGYTASPGAVAPGPTDLFDATSADGRVPAAFRQGMGAGFGPEGCPPHMEDSSTQKEQSVSKAGLARQLGLFGATMAVMGGIIGSGIFINPYLVAERVHTSAL